jgi:hypothetical protein
MKRSVPQQTLLGLHAEALPVNAAHAACAWFWLWLFAPLQSKKFWPTPSLCVV